MSALTANDLAKLLSDTQKLMLFYYSKDKWHQIFPLISHLAEQYDLFYIEHKQAMLAQLTFYLSKQGYTTNLVINQIIILLTFCHSSQINKAARQKLISACLCQYICYQKENNAIAMGQTLSPESIKLFKMRNKLTIKLLDYGKVPQGIIQNIFKNLSRYTQTISDHQSSCLLDTPTIFIATSALLAKKITLAKNTQVMNLQNAVAQIYQTSKQTNVLLLLKKLIQYLPCELPGSVLVFNNDYRSYYIGEFSDELNENTQYLTYQVPLKQSSKQGRFSINNAWLKTNSPQQVCQDLGLIFKIWFEPLTSIKQKNNITFNFIKNHESNHTQQNHLMSIISKKQHNTIDNLCDILSDQNKICLSLCQLATDSNRTGQTITSVRHAIMLLGTIRAPFLIKKILLQHELQQLNHPNWYLIEQRVLSLVEAAELTATNIYDFLPEEVSITILSYCYILLSQPDASPSLYVLKDSALPKNVQLSIENYLGLTWLPTNNKFESSILTTLSTKWINALTNLQAFNSNKNETLEFYAIVLSLVGVTYAYDCEYHPDAYTEQLLKLAIKKLKFKSLDTYLEKTHEFHFKNQLTY
ncbi:hypothetical protein [Pseudoalteromonas denitrificans]|uniref:Uncharacterized protein n=1 Tax=Pseudoalteromonas denitrificans DSM 6059 TaxID=1123010 RepID=A0A1I1GUF3_9GAMM|nr:hypothetical protein [Pseudoalteromonas denitrificans]SFC15086.1 hypothetical protein SAMN02745724_01032 [Pseudoalteromonas denitrificans DSM 6059]